MKILMTASEMTPYAKTGGLADVLGALPHALKACGQDVSVILPYYRSVEKQFPSPKIICSGNIPLGGKHCQFDILQLETKAGVHVYGIRKEEYFDRSYLYGTSSREYEDNAERFIFFSKAILYLIQTLQLQIDIIHAHDWQTGLLPLLIRQKQKEGSLLKAKSVYTIHNIAYQGHFDVREFALTNLPGSYFSSEGMEFYGRMNLMKTGMVYSDAITTVSPRYSREIQTQEFGYGLDGVLRSRKNSVFGIINGVDYKIWDPATDKFLAKNFKISAPAGKKDCKTSLLKSLRLDTTSSKPLFGMVSRLAHQKGIDLLLEVFPRMLKRGACFAILANGDDKFEKAFQKLAAEYPLQFGLKIGFDDALAHQIYGGSDFLLMPSLYEPCGLSQLYALRYGTIPVVRATGGLEDTVESWNPVTKKGNGLKFHDIQVEDFWRAIEKAFELFETPTILNAARKNAMKADFSWENSAREYENLYRTLLSNA
jgi:starch synthase